MALSKIKTFVFNALPGCVLCGVGFYIYKESDTRKHGKNYENFKTKINKLIGDNNNQKFFPEDIYALQFVERKRAYYKAYVTYPGGIITILTLPISVIAVVGGICTFNTELLVFGGCLNYLAVRSNIINNAISKMLSKNNLIIDKDDFLNIDEIDYCHGIMFDKEDFYTYSRKDALHQKKLDRLYA